MKRYLVAIQIFFLVLPLPTQAQSGAPSFVQLRDEVDYLTFAMGDDNPASFNNEEYQNLLKTPDIGSIRTAVTQTAKSRSEGLSIEGLQRDAKIQFPGVSKNEFSADLKTALWGRAGQAMMPETVFPWNLLEILNAKDEESGKTKAELLNERFPTSSGIRAELAKIIETMKAKVEETQKKLDPTAARKNDETPFDSNGGDRVPSRPNPPSEDRGSQTAGSPHGSSGPAGEEQRTSAPQPSARAQALAAKLNPGSKVTAQQIDENLEKLKSDKKEDRWAAADFFADNFPDPVLTELLGQSEVTGPGREVLEATQAARKEADPSKLRETARNATAPAPKREASRREILRRMEFDPKTKWAVADMPSVRPERAMEFTAKIVGSDLDQAAKTLADVIGTMSDEQLQDMLKNNRSRDVSSKTPEEKAYAQRAALAALEALKVRGVKVDELTNEELEKLGIKPADADEFRKKFKAAYEAKLDKNQNFQDKIEEGAHADEAKREEARKWLLDNYSKEDLLDYLGQQIELARKNNDPVAKRTAENLAKVLGVKDEDGNLVLELAANDAGFVAGDPNRSLFLGKDGDQTGNVFASLASFSDPVGHKDEVGTSSRSGKPLPTANRNRFQSFEVQPDHTQHESGDRQFYYAPEGKDSVEKYVVPKGAKKVAPSNPVATGTVAPKPTPKTTTAQPETPTTQTPATSPVRWGDSANAQVVAKSMAACLGCHASPKKAGGISVTSSTDPRAVRRAFVVAYWRKTTQNVANVEPTPTELVAASQQFLADEIPERMLGSDGNKPILNNSEIGELKKFFTAELSN